MIFYRYPKLDIGVAIMYHPKRAHYINDIISGCNPLSVQPVQDPDPEAFPSPLRTAKLAWSAVKAKSTHHLVLQDDVLLAPDFSERLYSVVARRPNDVLALYVSWNTQINAYFARLSAASGAPYAALSLHEWVPCLGLVMPSDLALDLADYLRIFPDERKADDLLIQDFCKLRRISVLAVIPSLIEHRVIPSLADNDNDGVRVGAVPVNSAHLSGWNWSRRKSTLSFFEHQNSGLPIFSLRMRNSRTNLRLLPSGEFTNHGWIPDDSWRVGLKRIGLTEGDIESDFLEAYEAIMPKEYLNGFPLSVSLEMWAYAWILGNHVARTGWPLLDVEPVELRLCALGTFLESGLLDEHRGLFLPEIKTAHLQLLLTALRLGEKHGKNTQC